MQQQEYQGHLATLQADHLPTLLTRIQACLRGLQRSSKALPNDWRPRLLTALSRATGHALDLVTGSSSTTELQLKYVPEVLLLLSCMHELVVPWTFALPDFQSKDTEAANKVLHAALANTRFMQQLAGAAVVVCANIRPDADADDRALLGAATLGRWLLRVRIQITCHDCQEAGFSSSAPQYVAVLPQVAALSRRLLCSCPAVDRGAAASNRAARQVWSDAVLDAVNMAHYMAGHLHMQYCAVAMTTLHHPEQGCNRSTAHMLARNEDVQVLLLVFLAVKVGACFGEQQTICQLQW